MNAHLSRWIQEAKTLCTPDAVHLCDGSQEEYDRLCAELVRKGVFLALHPERRPRSFWSHSDPRDVARSEEATYICSFLKEDSGPTNHWMEPDRMRSELRGLFAGCMRGRTLFVIPYCMGPLGSPFSRFGVQITDSPYVVCHMHWMTRMGRQALDAMREGPFVPGMHSVGMPLGAGMQDTYWPCAPAKKRIVHFPEERSIWSFGSGYGGNALLGKKSFALRIASVMGREEGWLAEHMLLIGVTNPAGEKRYFAAAFPSQCGKTNLAMLQPALEGWKVECVGDDIAWMHIGKDGRLWAINPEAGFFGVATGTSYASNPNAMQAIRSDTLFTNVALTKEGDVWWEGMTEGPPEGLTSWEGISWTRGSGKPAAHPNARFTVALKRSPVIDPAWDDPKGVPISGIFFGGRRANVVPLVCEAFDWDHGVFLGASISSETTAAAEGEVGKLRHDPFAMLPFCGYHMGDYFAHWLAMGRKTTQETLPKIFYVNWFRRSREGNWLWPGFGENIRVLKWAFERTASQRKARKTAIGYLPYEGDIDTTGLPISQRQLTELLDVDHKAWLQELEGLRSYFALFGAKLPQGIQQQMADLQHRLER